MNRIKELRKARKITQGELAEIFSTSLSNVSGWESEKWQPDIETLINLADFFGVSVEYLWGRTEKNLIVRPDYEITDKPLIDMMKLFEVMTEIQKAQVLGFTMGLLEQAGINVKSVLG